MFAKTLFARDEAVPRFFLADTRIEEDFQVTAAGDQLEALSLLR